MSHFPVEEFDPLHLIPPRFQSHEPNWVVAVLMKVMNPLRILEEVPWEKGASAMENSVIKQWFGHSEGQTMENIGD